MLELTLNFLGLKYYRLLTPPNLALLEPVTDSYTPFALGFHKHLYKRSIRMPQLGKKTLEDLHSSVYTYLQANSRYRPRNIPSNFLDHLDSTAEWT